MKTILRKASEPKIKRLVLTRRDGDWFELEVGSEVIGVQVNKHKGVSQFRVCIEASENVRVNRLDKGNED